LTIECSTRTVKTVGTELSLVEGGSGKPLLVFHEELGDPGWFKWQQELAKTHQVITPQHPGFGVSPRIPWAMNIGDLANFYAQVMVEQGWVGADVIGFSLGGWVAAEMAAQDPSLFSSMTLVGPAGIKPPEGFICDIYEIETPEYIANSVKNIANTAEYDNLFGGEITPEQYERFEDATAETARFAWQPYLNNPALSHRLGAVRDLPTLIIWGEDDGIVPISAADIYNQSIKGSKLVTLKDCGHRPEIEQTDKFLDEVRANLS